jgi:nitrate reductase NapE component
MTEDRERNVWNLYRTAAIAAFVIIGTALVAIIGAWIYLIVVGRPAPSIDNVASALVGGFLALAGQLFKQIGEYVGKAT